LFGAAIPRRKKTKKKIAKAKDYLLGGEYHHREVRGVSAQSKRGVYAFILQVVANGN
jgi:hypothetical protein